MRRRLWAAALTFTEATPANSRDPQTHTDAGSKRGGDALTVQTTGCFCRARPEKEPGQPLRTLKVWPSCNTGFSSSSSALDLTGCCQPSWLGSSRPDVTIKRRSGRVLRSLTVLKCRNYENSKPKRRYKVGEDTGSVFRVASVVLSL